jgi:CBS domain-containing protein
MLKAPPIRDVMTRNPITVDILDTASAAEKIMTSKGIHHLPVVDGNKVYGLISDRDIIVARRVYRNRPFDGKVLVKELCLEEPCTAREDEPLDKVARRMSQKKLDAVIVVRDETPVGIFTTTDACRFISQIFKAEAKSGFWAKLLGD